MTSETAALLIETATRIFDDLLTDDAIRQSRRGLIPERPWAAIEEAGLPLALIAEKDGGFGIDPFEALALVRLGGRYGAPVPLGETLVARWLAAGAGMEIDGPATFAAIPASCALTRSAEGWYLKGTAPAVPWGGQAATVVILIGESVILADPSGAAIEAVAGIGDLPRAPLRFDQRIADDRVGSLAGHDERTVERVGATLRVLEIAGALETLVAMTVRYATERVQFDRPLAKQQAIQQQIALMATHAAAASAAADMAARAFGGTGSPAAIAVAKTRAGEAAGIAAAITHQVHGAIGFTEEHRLHFFTKALWAWRDEYGSERRWSEQLGNRLLDLGADEFWPFITTLSQGAAE